jgi:predicted  nucleic acid-binding Zn-ribbon protein
MLEDAARQKGRLDLQATLEWLRQTLAELRQTYKEDYPEITALKQRIAQAESSMIASEYQLTHADEVRKRLAEMQSQLSSSRETMASAQELAQRRLNEALTLQRVGEAQRQLIVSKQALTNWTVKSIDIVGLSGEARDALLASLPVKVGGKLGEGSVDAIAAALKKFDEHLTFTVTLGSSGEAVIHVSTPKM